MPDSSGENDDKKRVLLKVPLQTECKMPFSHFPDAIALGSKNRAYEKFATAGVPRQAKRAAGARRAPFEGTKMP